MNKLNLIALALKIWLPLAQLILASYASGQGPLSLTPPPPALPAITESLGGLRKEHELVRRPRGLRDFIRNDTLQAVAQAHAEYMQRIRSVTHTGPGNSSVWDRVRASGYQYGALSESVTYTYGTPRDAVAGWVAGSNRENVLSLVWTEVGYGTAGTYHCAIYATRPVGASAAVGLRSQPQARRAPVAQYRRQGCCR